MSVEIERVVMNHVANNPGASVKSVALVEEFHAFAGGNVMTVEQRLSRTLARLYRAGKLDRKKFSLGPGYDGTRWVYGYNVSDS